MAMYVTPGMVPNYQCISHYGNVSMHVTMPMHVTLWHDTGNACHTTAQPPIHVTL